MTDEEKRSALTAAGWHLWYNHNYWVHSKTIIDPARQDYTNYGMSLEDAYRYETDPESKPWKGQLMNGAVRW